MNPRFVFQEKTKLARKTFFPKDNRTAARKIVSIMSQLREKKRETCLKKAIPRLKMDLLGYVNAKALRLEAKARAGRPAKVNKTVAMKEKQLKEILRPLIVTNTRRPRSKSLFFNR